MPWRMQEYLQKYHSTDDNYFLKIIHQKKHPFTYPKLAEEKADALKAELYINRGKQSLNFEIFWKKKRKKKTIGSGFHMIWRIMQIPEEPRWITRRYQLFIYIHAIKTNQRIAPRINSRRDTFTKMIVQFCFVFFSFTPSVEKVKDWSTF